MTVSGYVVIDAGVPRPQERVVGVRSLKVSGKVVDLFQGAESGKSFARVWDTVSGQTYWNRVRV